MTREEDINKEKVKVYVIGPKNPDTDSICSAIALVKAVRIISPAGRG